MAKKLGNMPEIEEEDVIDAEYTEVVEPEPEVEPQPKKKFKTKEEEAEEEAEKERSERERIELIAKMRARLENRYNVGDRESNVELIDPEGQKERSMDYFKDLDDYLANLHADGKYDAKLDVGEAHFEVRGEVRDEMAESNPEVDKCITDKANHQLNMDDAALQQSGGKYTLADMQFTDKDGNPLKFEFDGDYDKYNENMEAVIYGLDHGLIQAKMPDGSAFEPVKDEYTANLEYYDKMAPKMDSYMAEMEAKTADKIRNMTPEQQDALVPDYIKDPALREQYIQDTINDVNLHKGMYQKSADAYEAGKNPNIEALNRAGASFKQASNDYVKDNNVRALTDSEKPKSSEIDKVLAKAAALPGPDDYESEEVYEC